MITSSLWSTSILALIGGLGSDSALPESNPGLCDSHQRIETQANTFTQSAQEDATLAVDSDGRMLVAWASRRQEGGTYGVFAQLLDPLGRPIGTELHVNQTMRGNQSDPNLAFGPDGTAWATWSSTMANSEANGVFVRRLAQNEEGFGVIGDELRVTSDDFAFFQEPVVAVAENGTALIAWTRTTGAGTNVLEARSVASDGSLGELFVLEQEAALVRVPDLVAMPDGSFAAAWGRFDDLGRPLDLGGAILQADGTSHDFAIAEAKDERYEIEPSLDVDAAGNLLVAWMSADAYGDVSVMGRRFSAEGKAQGPAFEVETPAGGYVSGATAIVAPGGEFAVAFNHHTAQVREGQPVLKQTEVLAQLFDKQGVAQGERIALAQDSAGARSLQAGLNARRAAWTELGQLAVAWSGMTDGDKSGIGVTLFAPKDLDLPAPAAVKAMPALADLSSDEIEDLVKPDIIPPGMRNLPPVPATFGTAAGTGFRAHTQTQFTPPDPDIAVGPDRIVTQVNGRIRIFDKAGTQLLDQNTNGSAGFWGAQGGGTFIFDPINTYNIHSDRFFVANSELATGDFFTFAASTTNSPTSTNDWHKYRVQVTPVCNFPDFPNMGFNQDAYFITTDCFSGGGNRAYIIDRAAVESGAAITSLPSVQMSPGLQSLGNTKRYDVGTTQYFISAGFSSGSSLKIQAITNPTTTPNLVSINVSVPSFSTPTDAPQMGTTARLDVIDNRIKHGIVRNDILWCTQNVGVSGITRVRWYEIALNGWPTSGSNPSVLNQGDLDAGPGIYTFFGAVAVNANGDAVIAYDRSASNEFPSIEYMTRPSGDLVFSNPTPLQVSAANYTAGRYGDYAGLVIDPADDAQFWSHHEYSESNWATWVGSINVDPGQNLNPTADFTGTPLSGDAPLNVAFTDLSTSQGAGISSWAWSFGDGASSTAQNPSHLYVTPGTYTVSLTVTDDLGSDTKTLPGYVTVTLNMDASVIKRFGSGTNPDIFNTVTLPVIGTDWVSTIDSGSVGGGALNFVFGYDAPTQLPTAFGELLIDPTSNFFLGDAGINVGGTSTHAIPVPLDNSLIGVAVFTQGFVNNPPLLTNGLDLILGL